MQGTSSRAYSTSYARGTPGYRAPELVREIPVVTKRSDIWALGCILFELASGSRAFFSDIDVAGYMRGGSKVQIGGLHAELDRCLTSYVRNMVIAMLEIDWWKRPSARDVRLALETLTSEHVAEYGGGFNITSLNINSDMRYIHTFEVPQRPDRGLRHPPRDSERWEDAVWRPTWYIPSHI